MKSFGPKGLLKSKQSDELINCQIDNMLKITNNICVVTGFGSDKLTKKINKNAVSVVLNNHYDDYNEGYALSLLLDKYLNNIDGLLLVSNGLLFNTKIVDTHKSIIYTVQKKNKNFDVFKLGCIFDNKILENIFYDVGQNYWCEAVFISHKELEIIDKYRQQIDIKNMFLFEILGNSIIYGAQYFQQDIPKKNAIKIQCIKDSSKIKGAT
jgi:choline kinase